MRLGLNNIIKIRDKSLIVMQSPNPNKKRTDKQIEAEQNLVKGTPSGELKAGSTGKIKKYIRNWIEAVKYQDDKNNLNGQLIRDSLTFCTLTLSADQLHDDQFMNRYYLGNFIKDIKRKHRVKNYLWKAEPQKNGNLHYHIILDKRIDWKEVRNIWNRIQGHHGIIDIYKKNQEAWHYDGFTPRMELAKKWPIEKQKEAYKKGIETNWADPNSTDIHTLYNIDNPSSYVIKYMAKNEEERLIEARCWGCSDNLRSLEDFEVLADKKVLGMIEDVQGSDDYFVKKEDHYILICGNIGELIKTNLPEIYRAWNNNKNNNFWRLQDPEKVRKQKLAESERLRKYNDYYYKMRMINHFSSGMRKILSSSELRPMYLQGDLFKRNELFN